jgi:BirA family biotin operon repressor/biotin-[acetyl-CoA-carboxylase] ligase
MQIMAHVHKVLAMSHDTPRAPLDRKAISSQISQYWRVSVVEVTGSTQDDLIEKVETASAIAKSVIVAEFQSAGRGRLDRTFVAPQSSALTFSLYIEPKVNREEWSFIPLLAGLSMQEALTALDKSISVGIKWPNDLLIGEKKIAGIISQATARGVVIGIGVNVGMQRDELPVEHATSLAIANFAELDRNKILATFLNFFEVNLQVWELGQTFTAQYRLASVTLGRQVEITLPGDELLRATATGISETGALILDSGREVIAGDVIHLR